MTCIFSCVTEHLYAFKEMSFQVPCPFSNWIVFFLLNFKSSSIVCRLGLYQIYGLQIFSSTCRFVFHFLDNFLWLNTKMLNLHQVQFTYFGFCCFIVKFEVRYGKYLLTSKFVSVALYPWKHSVCSVILARDDQNSIVLWS